MTLAALTPKEYKVRFINLKLFWWKKDFPKDALVGITCVTSSAPQAYKLALRFRKAGASVVMGGPHVSALPEEALAYCDSVVVGEVEPVWGQVIKDYEGGGLKKTYRGEPAEDFFTPSYDYFLRLDPKILGRSGFATSRGCKYHCDFCARPSGRPRYVKIEQVAGIVKRMELAKPPFFLPHLSPIAFADDNIFCDPRRAKDLFKALAPLRIVWTANSSIDIAFDDEALRLAKKSGCQSLFVGFETLHPSSLRKTSQGNMRSPDDYIKAIRKIKSHRIMVTGSFILGLDDYTHLDYLRLIGFFIATFFRSRFFWISLLLLVPFPGPPLFDRLKSEGRIRCYDWSKYDGFFNIVFKPKRMSTFSLMAWSCAVRATALVCSSLGFYFLCLFLFPEMGYYILSGYVIIYSLWQAGYIVKEKMSNQGWHK